MQHVSTTTSTALLALFLQTSANRTSEPSTLPTSARVLLSHACCVGKHFFGYGDSVYNNKVELSQTDIQQTYHVAFKACVQKGRARSLMCAYSTVNGYQSCQHPALKDVVRDEWGFDGFICSDAGAVGLIKGQNNSVKAAIALKSGVDQDLDGGEYDGLTQALQLGWIEESDLDVSLTRVFRERIRTGQLDPAELVPYSKYDLSVVDLPASRAIARQAAREGTVLLKNEGGMLPIDLTASSLKNIAVVGPNADRLYTLLGVSGNAHSTTAMITPQSVITPCSTLYASLHLTHPPLLSSFLIFC